MVNGNRSAQHAQAGALWTFSGYLSPLNNLYFFRLVTNMASKANIKQLTFENFKMLALNILIFCKQYYYLVSVLTRSLDAYACYSLWHVDWYY